MIKNILSNGSKLVVLLLTLSLYGCGGSLPECSDEEVVKLLKKIYKKSGVNLTEVSGISTKDRKENTCSCSALGKFYEDGVEEEYGIIYTINLADNGEEFTVTTRLDF